MNLVNINELQVHYYLGIKSFKFIDLKENTIYHCGQANYTNQNIFTIVKYAVRKISFWKIP